MPIYLFWGDEDYNIEIELKKLKKSVLKGDISPLNYKTLVNPDFMALDEALRAQPMMFGEIVQVIKAEKIFNEGSKLNEEQVEELIKSVQNSSASVHSVFITPKKPDTRRKLYKAIDKTGTVKGFEALKAYEEYKAIPIIKKMALEKGIEASPDVLSAIFKNVGPSLRDLDNALEKLKLLAHPGKSVSKAMVEGICADKDDIFSLCDLVLAHDYANAIYEISKLLEKSHYLEVLAFLQNAFLKLLHTKLYSKRFSGFELAKKLGQHEFVVKKNLEKLSGVDICELVRLKQNLTKAEFKIKTGVCEPILALETAFLEGT